MGEHSGVGWLQVGVIAEGPLSRIGGDGMARAGRVLARIGVGEVDVGACVMREFGRDSGCMRVTIMLQGRTGPCLAMHWRFVVGDRWSLERAAWVETYEHASGVSEGSTEAWGALTAMGAFRVEFGLAEVWMALEMRYGEIRASATVGEMVRWFSQPGALEALYPGGTEADVIRIMGGKHANK